jgi:hypothetical protein
VKTLNTHTLLLLLVVVAAAIVVCLQAAQVTSLRNKDCVLGNYTNIPFRALHTTEKTYHSVPPNTVRKGKILCGVGLTEYGVSYHKITPTQPLINQWKRWFRAAIQENRAPIQHEFH